MKYKIAEELVENIRRFEKMDDLIVFRKPFQKTITFTFKDKTSKVMNMKDYSYVSLSNHGFLFFKNNPFERVAIPLNTVEDFNVK